MILEIEEIYDSTKKHLKVETQKHREPNLSVLAGESHQEPDIRVVRFDSSKNQKYKQPEDSKDIHKKSYQPYYDDFEAALLGVGNGDRITECLLKEKILTLAEVNSGRQKAGRE